MEILFIATASSLVVLTVLTMIAIVRDVFPLLNSEDQNSLRNYRNGASFSAWRSRDRAIHNAWNEHVRSFPRSRKRMLFALFLIVTWLSIMGYQLRLVFGSR